MTPEEKKNTMEKQFECKTCGAIYRTQTESSGSVAAPKELNEDQKLVSEIYRAHDAAGEGINKLFDRLSFLKEELSAAKESIKELEDYK